MRLTHLADRIMGDYVNGNITDALDALDSLGIREALIVAMIIGRDYETCKVNPLISRIYNRMGIN